MTEDEIRQATLAQLQVLVAGQLGWKQLDSLRHFATWQLPDGSHHYKLQLPDWPNNIALAWELDGEGWDWQFKEWADEGLDVSVWKFGVWPAIVSGTEPWRESKAQTYATARCRTWLLAKLADDAPPS